MTDGGEQAGAHPLNLRELQVAGDLVGQLLPLLLSRNPMARRGVRHDTDERGDDQEDRELDDVVTLAQTEGTPWGDEEVEREEVRDHRR